MTQLKLGLETPKAPSSGGRNVAFTLWITHCAAGRWHSQSAIEKSRSMKGVHWTLSTVHCPGVPLHRDLSQISVSTNSPQINSQPLDYLVSLLNRESVCTVDSPWNCWPLPAIAFNCLTIVNDSELSLISTACTSDPHRMQCQYALILRWIYHRIYLRIFYGIFQ